MGKLIDVDALRLMKVEECAGHTIEYAEGWKACIEWLKTLPDARPKRESKALLPCKCGCKRREHWYGGTKEYDEGLKCMKCGFTVWGKSEMDAIRKWNEAVRE